MGHNLRLETGRWAYLWQASRLKACLFYNIAFFNGHSNVLLCVFTA